MELDFGIGDTLVWVSQRPGRFVARAWHFCEGRIVFSGLVRGDARPCVGTWLCDALPEKYMAVDKNGKNDESYSAASSV